VWLPDRTADPKAVPIAELRAMADPLWMVDPASA
jgi:hypothetical protein